VAKWVAVCDEPFTAVNAPEFREMLQYAHRKQLRIPHDQSVKERIQKMSTAMKAGLTQIFAVRSFQESMNICLFIPGKCVGFCFVLGCMDVE
jgi:predicted phage tail protein